MESFLYRLGVFLGSEGFYHFSAGVGLLFMGVAALFVIPRKLKTDSKSETLVKKYERFIFQMLRDSLTNANNFKMPRHNERIIEDFMLTNGWKKCRTKEYRNLRNVGVEILEEIMNHNHFKPVPEKPKITAPRTIERKRRRMHSIDEVIQ